MLLLRVLLFLWLVCCIDWSVAEHPDACYRGEDCDAAGDSEELQPTVRMVQGEIMACAESSTVFFEYETWHIDPADENYAVQVSVFSLPSPWPDVTLQKECTPGGDTSQFSTEYIEAAMHFHRGKQGQVLIEDGGIPSLIVPVSRLNAGFYFISLHLLHRPKAGPEGGSGSNVTAEGGAVLRIMPGRGECLRQSMATDYCSHSAVEAILQALDLPPGEDEAAVWEAGENKAGGGSANLLHSGGAGRRRDLLQHVEVQTLERYGSSLQRLFEAADAAVQQERGGEPLFFVEIGANDGKFADPLYPLVTSRGWHGLLVEPVGDVFQLLLESYPTQQYPHLRFEQAAVVGEDEDGAVLSITRVPLSEVRAMEAECEGRTDADMCRYAIGVGTLRPDDKSHWILAEKGVKEEVRGISLGSLLGKHEVSRIDVLQVLLVARDPCAAVPVPRLYGRRPHLPLHALPLRSPLWSHSCSHVVGVGQVDCEGYDARIVSQLDLKRYRPLLVQVHNALRSCLSRSLLLVSPTLLRWGCCVWCKGLRGREGDFG
jgi:hypothetical protein